MAPIKFEENIKEKLEERTINPSPKSWEALANRLDEAPTKKNINRFRVVGIAASFIGVLLLITGIVNYNDKESFKTVETDVETKSNIVKDKIEGDKEINLLNDSKKEERIVDMENKTNHNIKRESLKIQKEQSIKKRTEGVASVVTNNNVNNKQKEVNTNIINTNKKSDNNARQNTINKAYIAFNTQGEGGKEKLLKNSTIPEEKKAIASNTNNQIIQVTDSELDKLLNNAKRDIAKKSSNPIPLDYNELLQDVEDNLEESFRDKILKTVKGGYHSVKSYVAERNE